MTEFWEKTDSLECFSTDEKLVECQNEHVYTRCFGGSRCYDLETKKVVGKADVEEDPILCSRLDFNTEVLYTAHKSKLIRAWQGPSLEPFLDFTPLKTDHKGPLVLIAIGNSRLITASAECVLKVWSLSQRHCSGVLRNCSALPLCLEYVEFENVAKIAICGTNSGSIHAWNADTNEIIATATKHFSQVADIKALPSSKSFVSAGRDKTLIFWSWNLQPQKVIPVFEELECIKLLSFGLASKITNQELDENDSFIVGSGENAKIRVWNTTKQTEILGEKDFSVTSKGVLLKSQKVSQLLVCQESLISLQDDLLCHVKFKKKNNKIDKDPICSNQHEALDLILIDGHYLVVATVSSVIKVYDVTNENKLMVAYGGHEDSVLALCPVNETTFASCGKDHSVCLWKIQNDKVNLMAKGTGHSSFVGAIASSSKSIFSASKDGILKVWKIPTEEEETELQTSRTLLAHDQEINCVQVSHDNQFVVTASQDKTCKVWRIMDMGLVKTLGSHRRGIWKVVFTVDSLWTASADCTIKRWSLKSWQCLSTFEGHLSSVLSLAVIDDKKLASVASDGLLKVWDSKSGNVLGTFDAHDDKIWAVTYCETNHQIITAGRDGNIFFWSDKTDEKKAEERDKANQLIQTEQTLSNYLQAGQLSKALRLSLRLDRPRQTKGTLQKLRKAGELEKALQTLDLDLKNILFKFVTQWNTIGGASCELAQSVLQLLITDYLSVEKDERPYQVDQRQLLGLSAYTEKHFKRLDKLQSRMAVVDLLLANM